MSTHHGPPCGHSILGTCTGCGGTNPNSIPPRFKIRRDERYGDMAEAIYSDATLATTCARCGTPLESTDATVDAVSEAHEEQCFVLGDIAEWRLDGLTWERVTVVRAYPGDKFEIEHARTVERWQVHRSEMRRVAREGQAVDPMDVKYDDVTMRELIQQDTENTRHDRLTMTGVSAWKFTPTQRAAVSAHWSAQLRAKVAASSERARLTVVASDLELETANCKDAE